MNKIRLILGKHRHRRKSSGGSSPAPSSRSHHQSSCSLRPQQHQTTQSQQEPSSTSTSSALSTSVSEPAPSSTSELPTCTPPNSEGYEPVGSKVGDSKNKEEAVTSRYPKSKLPTLPVEDNSDSESKTGCFPIRKSRSGSKEKRKKGSSSSNINKGSSPNNINKGSSASNINHRSPSRNSQCSEHNYESPKLLQRSDRITGQPFIYDRTGKPENEKKEIRNEAEDGYEPVGQISSFIARNDKLFNEVDDDVRNVEKKEMQEKHEVIITESETGKIIYKETICKENLDENEQIKHLRRFEEDKTGTNPEIAENPSKSESVTSDINQEEEAQSAEIKIQDKHRLESKEKEERFLKEKEEKERKKLEKEGKMAKDLAEKERKKKEKEEKKKLEKDTKEKKKSDEEKRNREKANKLQEEKDQREKEKLEKMKKEKEDQEEKQKEKENKILLENEEKEQKKKDKEEKRLQEQATKEKEKERKILAKIEKSQQEKESKLLQENSSQLGGHCNKDSDVLIQTDKELKENNSLLIVQDNNESNVLIQADQENQEIKEQSKTHVEIQDSIEEVNLSICSDKEIIEIQENNSLLIVQDNKESNVLIQEDQEHNKIKELPGSKVQLGNQDNNKSNESIQKGKEIKELQENNSKLIVQDTKESILSTQTDKDIKELQENNGKFIVQDSKESILSTQTDHEIKELQENNSKPIIQDVKENILSIHPDNKIKELQENNGKLIVQDIKQSILSTQTDKEIKELQENNSKLGEQDNKMNNVVIQMAQEAKLTKIEPEEGALVTQTPRDQDWTSTQPSSDDREMALTPRSPGESDGKYVSVVTNDDFASFQQNGFHDEEDIDFTPQNGYVEPEDMDTEDWHQAAQEKPSKKNGAQKTNMMGRLAAASSAIKNARLPSPGEIKDGYLNSAFHKSFHQPLAVKTKVEKVEVQKARQALTEEKTPAQLGNIESLSDIPLPSLKKAKTDGDEEEGPGMTMPKNMEELGQAAYNTLPSSWREQNILTAVKENLDPEELERNQTLTKTKTPAELAQINSLSDFPVPETIKNLLHFEKKENDKKETKKRRHSDSEPEVSEPFSIYSTLPRSMRETKLITNIKVEVDDETLKARQALVAAKSPAELSTISSLADIPLPSMLTNMMTRAPSAPGSKVDLDRRSSSKALSKMNLNEIYATLPKSLPKSLTMELMVSTKDEDQDLVATRRKMIGEKTPMELGNIGSISDLPIPAPLENLWAKKREDDTAPDKPKRRNMEEKRKRNLTTGAFLSADFLPESWRETKLLVRSEVGDVDDEELRARQELVETKKPAELSQIHGLSDFPVPDRIQTLMRPKKRVLKSTEEKEMSKKSSKSAMSLPTLSSLSIPQSLKAELLVKAKVENPERVAKNRELAKTKSVSELSQITGISDFPIPDGIENFFKQKPVKPSEQQPGTETSSERPTSPLSFKESIYESLPRSLREQQLLVTTKIEVDDEKLKERQELTRTKSPTELSQISSLADLPIPSPIENFLKKKSEDPNSPVPPPRKWRREDIYESLPSSLTMELAVGSKISDMDLEEVERLRSQTPAQLSEIHSLADIPIPEFIENLMKKEEPRNEPDPEKSTADEEATEKVPFSILTSLPASLMETKLMVKTVTEDPEVQAVRAEIVKSKSVSELAQINSLSDIPIPDVIENLVRQKSLAPTERKKKFKEKLKSQSTQSLQQSIYSSLPRSLKLDLLVSQTVEEPDVLAERRALVASKSVSELSRITSISDIPVPANLQRAFHKSMERLTNIGTKKENNDESSLESPRPSRSIGEDLYSSLPRSLTSTQLLVRTKVEEDGEILAQRQALVEAKSPVELSQINSLSDIPIPSRIEAWLHHTADDKGERTTDESPMTMPRTKKEFHEAVYSHLPSSLVQPVIVRSKVEDPDILFERQQLQQTKSIHELSKIRNLNEVPVPGNIIKLPDVPLPTMKDILRYIAPTKAQRTPRTPRSTATDTYHSYEANGNNDTAQSTPLAEDKDFVSTDVESPSPSMSLDRDLGYEVITKQEVKKDIIIECPAPVQIPVEKCDDAESSVPIPVDIPKAVEVPVDVTDVKPTDPIVISPEEEEEDQFSLAEQIRATPERSMRKTKKKNRRNHDVVEDLTDTVNVVSTPNSITSEDVEIPPPLPPKRVTPSPVKRPAPLTPQPSMEEEMEAIPVKGILTLEADLQGNIQVVRNEVQNKVPEPEQQPLPPRREKQSSSVEPREITEMTSPGPEERIQSRPLPAPPAPPRTMKKAKSSSVENSPRLTSSSRTEQVAEQFRTSSRTEQVTEQFRTCADSLATSRTLVANSSEDDVTLADSIVDSLVSCAETLCGDTEDNLDTCADTLTGDEQTEYFSDEDNPYPTVDFDEMMSKGPGAGAKIVEEHSRSSRSTVRKTESGRRLEEGTAQLSLELMEHVESLKTTLDNMSNRLGTRSRSRSKSTSRRASTLFKDSQ